MVMVMSRLRFLLPRREREAKGSSSFPVGLNQWRCSDLGVAGGILVMCNIQRTEQRVSDDDNLDDSLADARFICRGGSPKGDLIEFALCLLETGTLII